MPKVCLTCSEGVDLMKYHVTTIDKMPEWKKIRGDKTFFPNDMKIDLSNIRKYHPSNSNVKVQINLNENRKNRYIFYFAAQPSVKPLKYPKANEAYGNFNNSGITKSDKNGCATLLIKCPQNYKEKGLWYPHVHFIIANSTNTEWNTSLYTKLVLCSITRSNVKEAINNENHLILNALPLSNYIKNHIPKSHSLPLNSVCKLTKTETIKHIKHLLNNVQRIKHLVDNNKMKIFDIPIIVYCYDNNCNASIRLIKHLWKLGFKNIKEYSDGIKGWKK